MTKMPNMSKQLENSNLDIVSDFELTPVGGCFARASNFEP
jgi:hypothetical protein